MLRSRSCGINVIAYVRFRVPAAANGIMLSRPNHAVFVENLRQQWIQRVPSSTGLIRIRCYQLVIRLTICLRPKLGAELHLLYARLFAIPAIKTIDTFGRRTLLLFGFPSMAFWLAFTGGVFYLPEGKGKLAAIALGIYFFAICRCPFSPASR